MSKITLDVVKFTLILTRAYVCVTFHMYFFYHVMLLLQNINTITLTFLCACSYVGKNAANEPSSVSGEPQIACDVSQ